MSIDILKRIASRLGRQGPGSLDQQSLDTRFRDIVDQATPTVPPQFSNAQEPDGYSVESTFDRFKQHARDNLFEITELRSLAAVPACLEQTSLPIVLSPQSSLMQLDWSALHSRITDNHQTACLAVVEATGAIAETGTVAIGSTDCPSRLLFLSEELAIVMRKSLVVPLMEDLWLQFGHMNRRALHLISGPSRTADVEQTLQVGAHGPRRVYLYIIDD
jgi:Uncharacterized conserved protein